MPLEHRAAESAAPLELPASLGPSLVDRAEPRDRIEADTRAVAPLIQAAYPIVLDHPRLRHDIHARDQLDHLVAATPAAGAGGKFG